MMREALYADLFRSLSDRFGKDSCPGEQIHVIHWWGTVETEEIAKERYLAQNPSVQILPEDLCVFLRHFGPLTRG